MALTKYTIKLYQDAFDFIEKNNFCTYNELQGHLEKLGHKDFLPNSIVRELDRRGNISLERSRTKGRYAGSEKKCLKRPE